MTHPKGISKRANRAAPSALVRASAALIQQFKEQLMRDPSSLGLGSEEPFSPQDRADLIRLEKLNQRKAHRRKLPSTRGQETRNAIADEANRQVLGDEFYVKHIPGFDPNSSTAQDQIDAFEDKLRKMKRRDAVTAQKQAQEAEASYPVFNIKWKQPHGKQSAPTTNSEEPIDVNHFLSWKAAHWDKLGPTSKTVKRTVKVIHFSSRRTSK